MPSTTCQFFKMRVESRASVSASSSYPTDPRRKITSEKVSSLSSAEVAEVAEVAELVEFILYRVLIFFKKQYQFLKIPVRTAVLI